MISMLRFGPEIRVMPELVDLAMADLVEHARLVEPLHLRDLFAADPQRFQRFSVALDDLLIDYAKNRIVPQTMERLM